MRILRLKSPGRMTYEERMYVSGWMKASAGIERGWRNTKNLIKSGTAKPLKTGGNIVKKVSGKIGSIGVDFNKSGSGVAATLGTVGTGPLLTGKSDTLFKAIRKTELRGNKDLVTRLARMKGTSVLNALGMANNAARSAWSHYAATEAKALPSYAASVGKVVALDILSTGLAAAATAKAGRGVLHNIRHAFNPLLMARNRNQGMSTIGAMGAGIKLSVKGSVSSLKTIGNTAADFNGVTAGITTATLNLGGATLNFILSSGKDTTRGVIRSLLNPFLTVGKGAETLRTANLGVITGGLSGAINSLSNAIGGTWLGPGVNTFCVGRASGVELVGRGVGLELNRRHGKALDYLAGKISNTKAALSVASGIDTVKTKAGQAGSWLGGLFKKKQPVPLLLPVYNHS